MKIAGTLLLLLTLAPSYAQAYIIDFTGTMELTKSYGDPNQPELRYVPFEVEGDTETLNFLTMSIWIDGAKLTHVRENSGTNAEWHYSEHLHQWEAVGQFGWRFMFGELTYDLHWDWVEITAEPDTNPIEQFPNFIEGPWYSLIYDEQSVTEYFTWPEPGITGVARVPEPATLSLLFLGLAAIGIRRRLR